MRKLTRLQKITAIGAFGIAGITAPIVAAATDGDPTAQADISTVAEAAAVPTDQQLHPVEITADQKTFTPDAEQLKNAEAIVEAGKDMGLPPRAWVIAVATSLQESNLENIGHLGDSNDHDSLGLFQQRPSTGWGAPDELTDPTYAATAFFEGTESNPGLLDVEGYESMALTDAAQEVQVSAYPDHYAKHEAMAGEIVKTVLGS